MEDLLKEINEVLDRWFKSCKQDDLDPMDVLHGVEQAVTVTDTIIMKHGLRMVAVPVEMFKDMGALATLGKHVVVTRLLSDGAMDPEDLTLTK